MTLDLVCCPHKFNSSRSFEALFKAYSTWELFVVVIQCSVDILVVTTHIQEAEILGLYGNLGYLIMTFVRTMVTAINMTVLIRIYGGWLQVERICMSDWAGSNLSSYWMSDPQGYQSQLLCHSSDHLHCMCQTTFSLFNCVFCQLKILLQHPLKSTVCVVCMRVLDHFCYVIYHLMRSSFANMNSLG